MKNKTQLKRETKEYAAKCIREISICLHDMITDTFDAIENDEGPGELDLDKMLILLEEIGVMATTIVGDYTSDEFQEMVDEILMKWKKIELERELERELGCNTIN